MGEFALPDPAELGINEEGRDETAELNEAELAQDDRQRVDAVTAEIEADELVAPADELPVKLGEINYISPDQLPPPLGENPTEEELHNVKLENARVIEQILHSHDVISSYRPESQELCVGMTCVTKQGEFGRIVLFDVAQDPKYPENPQATIVKPVVELMSGERKVAPDTKALYSLTNSKYPKKLPPELAAQMEVTLADGRTVRERDYVRLSDQAEVIGQVALVPDQEVWPGKVVVRLQDWCGTGQLIVFSVEELLPR